MQNNKNGNITRGSIRGFRHGELFFQIIDKLPPKLEETKTKEILKGSHGNPHTFDNGKLYLKNEDDYILGYFQAKNTTLHHIDHGKNGKAKLPDGNYRLRRQVEWINDQLRVIDD